MWLPVDGGSARDQRVAGRPDNLARSSPASYPPPPGLALDPALPDRNIFGY
jgi:hypothetical protein